MIKKQRIMKEENIQSIHRHNLHLFQIPILVEVPSTKATSLRGRKLVFPSPNVADKVKSRRPLIRASSKQEILVKNDAVGVSS
jgi:hypothetical protein